MAALPFNRNWRYTQIGNIRSSDIVYAMMTTPINRSVSLKFDPYMKYTWQNMGTYGRWPLPTDNWCMCMVSGNQITGMGNNPIQGFGGGRRLTVAKWPGESNETIGNRIWHELLEAQNISPDKLGPNQPNSDFPRFKSYVLSSPQWRNNQTILNWINYPSAGVNVYANNTIIRAYYTMLWTAAGYPIG